VAAELDGRRQVAPLRGAPQRLEDGDEVDPAVPEEQVLVHALPVVVEVDVP